MPRENDILELSNHTKNRLKVIVEPWAYEYRIEPQKTVVIKLIGVSDDPAHIEYHQDCILLWAWFGDYEITCDGEPLNYDFD
jgi:hypothetical protein